MAIYSEISQKMVIFHAFVSLPEGPFLIADTVSQRLTPLLTQSVKALLLAHDVVYLLHLDDCSLRSVGQIVTDVFHI